LKPNIDLTCRQFIAKLHAHDSCTEYIHDFLTVIEKDMLIVKPDDPAVRGRSSCNEVKAKLHDMLKRCRADASYAFEPSKTRKDQNQTTQEAAGADTLISSTDIHSGQHFPREAESAQTGEEPNPGFEFTAVPRRSSIISISPAPESPSSSEDESLEDQIINSYETSRFPPGNKPQEFLPRSQLDRLLTVSSITNKLFVDVDTTLVQWIFRSSRKVFAIAVMCGLAGRALLKAMEEFRKVDFVDESLPLSKDTQAQIACFSTTPWRGLKSHNFLTQQWIFLAPIFSKRNFGMDLALEYILPFTSVSSEVKEGHFGRVYRVKVHPSHQENSYQENSILKVSLHLHNFSVTGLFLALELTMYSTLASLLHFKVLIPTMKQQASIPTGRRR
jgi:hypothetical protein